MGVEHRGRRGVLQAVVTEPLDRVRRRHHRLAEARPQRLVHERTNVAAVQRPGRRGPREDFPIVAIDREGHREHLPTPARDQEDVRAPALIRGRLLHLAQMRLAVPAMDPRRQHQAVHPHEPPNAFAVVARAEGAIHHRPHPGIAVGGAAVGDGADLLEHRLVVESPVEARRPHARGIVRRLPRHPERATDRRHRMLGHRPDPLRNHGLFTTSCAACRISISICFLPSSRSSSRIR